MAKSAKKPGKTTYDTHPGVVMEQKTIDRMKEKTGRSLDEWIALVKKEGPAGTKERAAWLKARHGFGTNYAGWIADRAEGKSMDYDPEGLVAVMFAGPKAALRPIYDRLLALGRGLGDDVIVAPCSTIIPLRRRYVFAQIKPSTLTRIDLGLALGDVKAPARLIDTGGLAKGDRITHRIPISSLVEINPEVTRWLKQAYAKGNDPITTKKK